ncbi:hypothetical protein QWZ04_02890 [Vibrio tapetis subsp. quintayensis]|nr:hypothetical protein [Vibrio tapetis]MDN3679274.1 hypothetical protein [Vibrio tapetis subsp. quintayensis]
MASNMLILLTACKNSVEGETHAFNPKAKKADEFNNTKKSAELKKQDER